MKLQVALVLTLVACGSSSQTVRTDAGGLPDGAAPRDGATDGSPAGADAGKTGSGPWVSGYYAGWTQAAMAPDQIDYSAVTHIMHFAVLPLTSGMLDDTNLQVGAANATAAVRAAHGAGVKILITLGGASTQDAFEGAVASGNRAAFIQRVVSFMQSRGYDGIDVDWEAGGGETMDFAKWTPLVHDLRSALNAVSPRPLLTAAIGADHNFAAAAADLDQMNMMTYDMSGPYGGWVTWHSTPLYRGSFSFPSTGGPLPSIDDDVKTMLAAGVPAAKLGIGIAFHGEVWKGGIVTGTQNGVTAPRQSWTTAPTMTGDVAYSDLMTSYGAMTPLWDDTARVPYFSVDAAGSANDLFVSFENERSIGEKAAYIKSRGLGGAIIWQLGAGYRATQPAGQRAPLLAAVKTGLR